MSKTHLWTRAAHAMRADEDPRWHAVADWLRSEVATHNEMEPFTDLINATIEQASGIKGYIRFGRDTNGDPSMVLDTSEGATAVALAYLNETPDQTAGQTTDQTPKREETP